VSLVKIHRRFRTRARCRSTARTEVCEIGTIDCIHDQSSEKRASAGDNRRRGQGSSNGE